MRRLRLRQGLRTPGLGSIVLSTLQPHVDCNRCAIAIACPKDAIAQEQVKEALEIGGAAKPVT
jgi:hypothetical protein